LHHCYLLLYFQLGKEGTVTVEELREKWLAICLKEEGLYQMLKIGQFGATLDWLCFIGVAAGFLTSVSSVDLVLTGIYEKKKFVVTQFL